MRDRNHRNLLPWRDGVRLAFQFPAAEAGGEVAEAGSGLAEIARAAVADAAMGHLVRPLMLLEILGGIQHRTGFEQRDRDPSR